MENIIFADNFTDALAADWLWLREEPSAWCAAEGTLHLRALPGTLWGANNTARNFALRPAQPLREGLAAEVTVTNQPVIHAEQAGMIWYCDDDNYVKFIKESLDGTVWIIMAREEEGQSALVNRIPALAETVRLRLTLVEGQVTGQFCIADGDWQTVGACAPVQKGDVHIGLFTHGGPADEEHWAQFAAFRMLG